MSVQGKWNISLQTPMGDKSGTLDLKVEGSTLAGSLYNADYSAELVDGKLEGNRLSWSAKITQPIKLSLKFTATVAEDRIEGVAKHLLGRVTFRGTRA